MKLKKGFRQLVDEAKSRIKTLSLEEARARHGKDDVVFVDLRDVRELEREGMIPDAVHCPRGMLEFWIDPESPYHKTFFASGKTFVFFCAGGLQELFAFGGGGFAERFDRLYAKRLDDGFHLFNGRRIAAPETDRRAADTI